MIYRNVYLYKETQIIVSYYQGWRNIPFLLFCALHVYTNSLELTKIIGKTYTTLIIIYIYY